MITEDGEIFKSEVLADDDKEAANAGILDIIYIDDAGVPTQYLNNEWHPIRSC